MLAPGGTEAGRQGPRHEDIQPARGQSAQHHRAPGGLAGAAGPTINSSCPELQMGVLQKTIRKLGA